MNVISKLLLTCTIIFSLSGCGAGESLKGDIVSVSVDTICKITSPCHEVFRIKGWACQVKAEELIDIELYAGKEGDEVYLGKWPTFSAEYSDVYHGECGTTEARHGILISMNVADAYKHKGKEVRIKALQIPGSNIKDIFINNKAGFSFPFENDEDEIVYNIKKQWDNINNVVKTGKKEEIVKLFHPQVQEQYEPIIETLNDELISIFSSLKDFSPIAVTDSTTEAVVTRTIGDKKHAFIITFTKDHDSEWSISSM